MGSVTDQTPPASTDVLSAPTAGRVSEEALQQTGDLPIAHLPEHVDEVLVIDIATVVDRYFTERKTGA
jgi:hypothetical protein